MSASTVPRQPDGFQQPAAAIALRDGHAPSEHELLADLNSVLKSSEQLCMLDILEWRAFPMGVTGKTLKRVFRERTEPGAARELNRPIVHGYV